MNLRLAMLLLGPALAIGCSPGAGEQARPIAPRATLDPSGEMPLVVLPDADAIDAIAWASLEVDEQRAAGVRWLIPELAAALYAEGIDPAVVLRIDDAVATAPPNDASRVPASAGGVGQQRHGLGQPTELVQYYDCPLFAPATDGGASCDQLVDAVVLRVHRGMEQQRGALQQAYDESFARLAPAARAFIAAWADEAQVFGARLAGVVAKQELRGAGLCDARPTPEAVARALGREQGAQLVVARRAWAIQQLQSCAINTDVIAEQVRATAQAQVEVTLAEHTVCPSVDLNAVNEAYEAGEQYRREGIRVGIDERVELLRQELFTIRQQLACSVPTPGVPAPPPAAEDACLAGSDATCDLGAACDVAGCGPHGVDDPRCLPDGKMEYVGGRCMCCRLITKDGGRKGCRGSGWSSNIYCKERPDGSMSCQCGFLPLGSPVVVDLDGDGLELSGETVRFDLLDRGDDGQRTTWVGPGEGLLALDRDGDGRISSGAELFGDRSACGAQRCYDGVEALRFWDAPARGGNGDGLIDARDAVYPRLRVWVDADHDGASAPGELGTLAQHGLIALALDADYRAERRAEGAISARLEVLTAQGPRRAHDVWFKLALRTAELGALLPGAR